MTTYYVWSGAGGTNSGTSWTDAYTTYGSAVTAATADGDIIKVHYTHTEELSATTTYSFTNNVRTVSVDKDSSDALTAMGATHWLGSSSTNITINFRSSTNKNQFFHGITVRNGTLVAGNLNIVLSYDDNAHQEYEDCYIWNASAGSSALIIVGNGASGAVDQSFTRFKNCTIRFSRDSQVLSIGGHVQIEGGSLSSAGTIPLVFAKANRAASVLDVTGFDASALASNTLIGTSTDHKLIAKFSQCKLGTSMVPLATQTPTNRAGSEVSLFDCNSGDTHGIFGYYNALGSVVSDTGIYFTAGAAAQSWKIVTAASCSVYAPFETPWIDLYNTTLSAQSPYIEILRDGSATAYQDDEVWIDVMAKTVGASPISSLTTDRVTPLGTPANQAAGAGLGSWTGEAGTAWSGKCAVASLTPAENGHIRARIAVGEPSITVYADPQIRT